MHDLNKGGFLAHRIRKENEDDTKTRTQVGSTLRANRERGLPRGTIAEITATSFFFGEKVAVTIMLRCLVVSSKVSSYPCVRAPLRQFRVPAKYGHCPTNSP